MSGRKRYDAGGKITLNGHDILPKDLELLAYAAVHGAIARLGLITFASQQLIR